MYFSKIKRLINTIKKFGPKKIWDSRHYLIIKYIKNEKYFNKIKERLENKKCMDDIKLRFFYETGYEPDLENPKTFCEKVAWTALFGSTPLKERLCDKYLAKEWINEKLGGEYAVPLLGVWDRFDDIDFDLLPEQFALKVNSGCHWNKLVRDRSKMNIKKMKRNFDNWTTWNYTYCGLYERQYENLEPKIIAEKCLPKLFKGSSEYKILCFNGHADSIYVFEKPVINGKKTYTTTMYTPEWKKLDWVTDAEWPSNPGESPRPEKLEEMVRIAEKLSEGINFVRVDMYEVSGRIYVGEMTFTPSGGLFRISSRKEDLRLGELMVL